MFKHAIVKVPGQTVLQGITSSPQLGTPNYANALAQHNAYINALQSCGVEVTVLPADEAYPDSCFTEDVAVVNAKCAVVTNPGADTRQGETAAIVPVLEQFYPKENIHFIKAPGTLEGGDVMQVEDTYYVGRSARTNAEGIAQFAAILKPYGFTVIEVPLTEVLHLKTGVNYIADGNMLVSGEFVDKPEFAQYKKYIVPPEEAYAANSVWMNGKVLVPAGFPTVAKLVEEMGYPIVLVDTSEFRKIDGGLSCLSLRLPI